MNHQIGNGPDIPPDWLTHPGRLLWRMFMYAKQRQSGILSNFGMTDFPKKIFILYDWVWTADVVLQLYISFVQDKWL